MKSLITLCLMLLLPAGVWAKSVNSQCMKELHPVIGVSGEAPDSRTVVPMMSVLRSLGASPVYINQTKGRDPADDLPELHGLIIAGNSGDIDPERYGAPNIHPKTNIEKNTNRADYEYRAVELALKRKLPLLGICGGMQRITTSGPESVRGTLIQHTENQNQGKKTPPVPPYIASETINLKSDSWLAELISERSTKVNSYHHQAPDRLRKGFRVSALSEYGTIEAMEPEANGPYAGQFAIGVMWHPEFSESELSMKLMREFVEASRSNACAIPE